MAFNKLSPAEAERLALLLEELGEAQQAIGKILRHGYENYHPDFPEISNRDDLEKEIAHIRHAIYLMEQAKDIDPANNAGYQYSKMVNISKYLHHQSHAVTGTTQLM